MNKAPFPYRDFVRVRSVINTAILDQRETFVMLVGNTGTGKTALMRDLKADLDRPRFRTFYFSGAKRLGAAGLVKVVGEALRVRSSICHSVTLDRVQKALADDPQKILLWLDEAHDLAPDTLAEVRALAESDLDGTTRIQVLLAGLPKLRPALQDHPHLWRRIVVREEIAGLAEDEMPGLLEHHFEANGKRLCDRGLRALFERGKGAPGVILPMYRAVLARAAAKGKIESGLVEESLERWDLP